MSTLSSESVILDDNLETMIYAHYLTELGFKQKQYNHDLEGTKHKFSWIKVPIRWIKIRAVSMGGSNELVECFCGGAVAEGGSGAVVRVR